MEDKQKDDAQKTPADSPQSELLELDGDEQYVAEAFYKLGFTDGLPIIVPTVERTERMLLPVAYAPSESIGKIMPRRAPATVQKIAANAVMAGCLPEYMPVLLASVEAIQDPKFNLNGVLTTTHPCAVMTIVNGPIAKELEMNSGHNCLGPGNRANATIGRAIRLILQNIGGGIPMETDKSTQGTPGKYTYCFAENEAESPWPPLRVSLGFEESDSCITVVAAEAPHNINDHGSKEGRSILDTIAQSMATVGNNNLYLGGDTYLIIGPEHARTIWSSGYSRQDVQEYLYKHARVPMERMSKGKLEELTSWKILDEDKIQAWKGCLPLVSEGELIRILVAGGAGKHSAWCPTFGISESVTRRIDPSKSNLQACSLMGGACEECKV